MIVYEPPRDPFAVGSDRHVPRSDIQGIVADLIIRLNEPEHRRRRLAGIGAETRRDVLNRLMGISAEWMPAREVEHEALLLLIDDAPGTIELRQTGRRGTQVRRLLAPPLTIEHITVRARDWERGFAAINAVAGFAARSLILAADPADRQLAELEASLLGIGLSIDRAGDLQTLTPAARFKSEFFSAFAWQVAEGVYESALPRDVL